MEQENIIDECNSLSSGGYKDTVQGLIFAFGTVVASGHFCHLCSATGEGDSRFRVERDAMLYSSNCLSVCYSIHQEMAHNTTT